VLLHGFVLNERQHAIASPESEEAYLEESEKQVKEKHIVLIL
jgi:hypothetical protein